MIREIAHHNNSLDIKARKISGFHHSCLTMFMLKNKCPFCSRRFQVEENFQAHKIVCAAASINSDAEYRDFKLVESAFNRFFGVFIKDGLHYSDLQAFFIGEKNGIHSLMEKILQEIGVYKIQFCIHSKFHKPTIEGNQECEVFLCSSTKPVLSSDFIIETLQRCQEEIEERFDQFVRRGSNWILDNISIIEVKIGKYVPYQGGCFTFELPKFLVNKKCLTNIRIDEDCFIFSVLAYLHPVKKNKDRPSNYTQFLEEYDFSKCHGMVTLKDISWFEKRNNITVNVYSLDNDNKTIIPIKVSKKRVKYVELFLYKEHYYCITSFSRFVGAAHGFRRHYCYFCLHGLKTEESLERHISYCENLDAQRVQLPKFGNIKFTHYEKMLKAPFVVYADFETFVKSDEYDESANTFQYQHFEASSFSYVIVNWNGEIVREKLHRGENAGKKFLQSMMEEYNWVRDNLKSSYKPLNLTKNEEDIFQSSKHCHICEEELMDDQIRVRDHDHLTGAFRGAAHTWCNINYRYTSKLPIVFHNLKNFDSHLIVDALEVNMFKNINVIPHNIEKFIAMMFDELVFIDSYAFLTSSLDTLSQNLSDEQKKPFFKPFFKDDEIELLLKKGALPYEYLSSAEKFNETELPPIEKFFSKLTSKSLDAETYDRLKTIWSVFGCKNIGDFHDIYLRTDVILLTAIFENFRKMSMEEFKLDPAHFFSAPGLSWMAALKVTRVSMDFIKDIDMMLMIERGIRGGVTSAVRRYVKSNNPKCVDFDESLRISHILYTDVNNLYGYALKQPLPYKNFKLVCENQFQQVVDLIVNDKIPEEEGFILEVDLEYPSHLHDLHNDFPLAPEKKVVKFEELSEYQKRIVNSLKERGINNVSSMKLIPNLRGKEKYVIHYRNLQYYLQKGLVLKKIHKIIRFNQAPILKSYIDLCTSKRQQAKSTFEKDFWKLLVNSLYGKSIENKRNHCEVKIVLKEKAAEKHVRKPTFEQFVILDENKVLIKMKKANILLDKPIYLGFSVLEFAKKYMYHLHYDIFKRKFNEDIKLIYTDTDSLIYHINTDNLLGDLNDLRGIMDFSNYPSNHFLYDNSNEKVVGKLKDEMGGKNIDSITVLKSEMYCIKVGDTEKKAAKGVQKNQIESQLSQNVFLECLQKENIFHTTMRRIQSRKHKLQAIEQKKLALTSLDDKRYYINAFESYAFGHFKTIESSLMDP